MYYPVDFESSNIIWEIGMWLHFFKWRKGDCHELRRKQWPEVHSAIKGAQIEWGRKKREWRFEKTVISF